MLIITFNNVFFNTGELLVFNDNFELISKNIIPEKESPDLNAHDGFVINSYDGNIPCKYENNINPLYPRNIDTYVENEEDREYNQFVKIEDNKIYFLYPKLNLDSNGNFNENNYGILEERVYTINNSKIRI